MNTEIEQIADSAGDTATTVAEVAFGAAKTVAEVASDPIGSARKQVKGLERKGTPTARRVNRRFNARINALVPERIIVLGVEVNGKLPEKVAIKSLHLVKVQARRQDVVGDVAKRALRIFNGSFKTIARTATRLEQATATHPAATKRPAASKTATRTASRTRRTRRGVARRRAA